MTENEAAELVSYLRTCNERNEGKNRDEVRQKIRDILYARDNQNKRLFSSKREALTPAERHIITSSSGPNDAWFLNFYARYRDVISEKTPKGIKTERFQAGTEKKVQEHFYGQFGLFNELLAAGVMNKETGKIDPSRLLNMDETPESIDSTNDDKKRKVIAGAADSCIVVNSEDRENYTVNMIADLGGFKYGAHIIFAAKLLSSGLISEDNDDEEEEEDEQDVNVKEIFDNTIDERRKVSTHCLVSVTECGQQTHSSLRDRLRMFLEELEKRASKITFPVVLCVDNHGSRFAELAQVWLQENINYVRLFTELPNTSHWAQMWDQLNHKFHEANKIQKREYKISRAYALQCNASDIKITKARCVKILSETWWNFASPGDIKTAWRKVGVTNNELAPELIDRKHFADRQQPKTPEQSKGTGSKLVFIQSNGLPNPLQSAIELPLPTVTETRSKQAFNEKRIEQLLQHSNTLESYIKRSPEHLGVLNPPPEAQRNVVKPVSKKKRIKIASQLTGLNAASII